jgi:glyoxylase-like metal-dependent hydrolase (beta-lactamase superfamily II)
MEQNSNPEITSADLYKKLQSGRPPLLLDVRGEKKHKEWHIFDSENIPVMKLLETDEFPDRFRDREIITICGLGNDSLKAAKHLQNKGFNAFSVHGGLNEWNTVYDIVDIPTNSEVRLTQFRRIAKGCLSYVLSANGQAIAFDPSFNAKSYLSFIDKNDLVIKKVFDTHLHVDHVSGAKNLAEMVDADLYLPDKDPFNIKYFDYSPIKHNAEYNLDGTYLKAIHTPGHTKGSISFQIKEFGLLTGDTIFVDGVGRPDLAIQAEEFARDLYDSISNRILILPQKMFIAPAHHGKFEYKHFNQPIMTSINEISRDSVANKEEADFIQYALEKVQSLPHPPSYKTIRQINSGDLSMTPAKISELEIGPNRCAIG